MTKRSEFYVCHQLKGFTCDMSRMCIPDLKITVNGNNYLKIPTHATSLKSV